MSKTIKTRIQNKHDLAANWAQATFTSLKGEFYVYDDYDPPRLKIGDGVHTVKDLPFTDEPFNNVQSDWNVTDTSSDAYIKNKPAIPTVNNGTLTIKQNGAVKGTFTANNAGNVTVELSDTANTDAKTSSGDTNSKIYLVGATSQSTSGQTTYSHNEVYVNTDHELVAEVCVRTSGAFISEYDNGNSRTQYGYGSINQFGGDDGYDQRTLEIPFENGTLATQEWVQANVSGGSDIDTSNLVDKTSNQTISGQKTFSKQTVFNVDNLALKIQRSQGSAFTGIGANTSYRTELKNSSNTNIAGSELRQDGLYVSENGTSDYKKVAYAADLAGKADIINIEEMTLILDPTNTYGTIPKSIIPAGTIGIQKVGKTTGKYGYYASWSDKTGCEFSGSDGSYGSYDSIYNADEDFYEYNLTDNLNYYYAVVPAENTGTINCERNHKDILDIKQELNPTYNNSLISDALAADPSIWEENGIFYMLATDKSVAESGEDYGNNDPSQGLSTAVFTSTDLVNWKYQYGGDKLYGENGLATICNFVNSSVTFDCNIWGAQAIKINGEVVIYGCIHNGSGKTAIFAARRTASGYFDNIIKITDSTAEGIWCNDPYVVKDFDGTFYMFFGSRNGIYRLSLGKDGLTKTGSKVHVAGVNWNGSGDRPTNCYEGATVFHHGNFWYLLASGGDAIASEGASNAYYVGVARSTSLTGTFVNQDDEGVTSGTSLTPILQSSNGFRNPGHTSNPFVDADGNWYIMYHAITTEGQYGTALYRRPQMLPLKWKTRESGYTWDNINIADAWPYFSDDNKPYTTAKAPKLPVKINLDINKSDTSFDTSITYWLNCGGAPIED